MTYVRVISSTTTCNAWERKAPDLEKMVKAFLPYDDNLITSNDIGEEVWGGVSVYRADSWALERVCAAAVKFISSPDSWKDSCLLLRINEEMIEESSLDIEQTPVNPDNQPQTFFTKLNPYHHDLSGEKANFVELTRCIYEKHRQKGDAIVPMSFTALFEGGLCLEQHSDIEICKKVDALSRLLKKLSAKGENHPEYPHHTEDPFGELDEKN